MVQKRAQYRKLWSDPNKSHTIKWKATQRSKPWARRMEDGKKEEQKAIESIETQKYVICIQTVAYLSKESKKWNENGLWKKLATDTFNQRLCIVRMVKIVPLLLLLAAAVVM